MSTKTIRPRDRGLYMKHKLDSWGLCRMKLTSAAVDVEREVWDWCDGELVRACVSDAAEQWAQRLEEAARLHAALFSRQPRISATGGCEFVASRCSPIAARPLTQPEVHRHGSGLHQPPARPPHYSQRQRLHGGIWGEILRPHRPVFQIASPAGRILARSVRSPPLAGSLLVARGTQTPSLSLLLSA